MITSVVKGARDPKMGPAQRRSDDGLPAMSELWWVERSETLGGVPHPGGNPRLVNWCPRIFATPWSSLAEKRSPRHARVRSSVVHTKGVELLPWA